MFMAFIILAFIGGSFGHTYGHMQQIQGFPENAYIIDQNGQPMMARFHTTTTTQRCCWVKKCRNQICQESYACGDSCPAPNWNIGQNPSTSQVQPMPGRSNFAPAEQYPTTQIKCCIMQQCNSNGQCQQTFTCGDKCAKATPQQPRETEAVQPDYQAPSESPQKLQHTTPRPYLPSRNPMNNQQANLDFTPEFQPLPGVFLDGDKPKDKKPESTSAKTTTTVKPEKCKDGVLHFPDAEEDEDFGPTPGYDLKHEYKRNKCDKNGCKMVTVKCGKCPDPFDPQFRLYKVTKECFKCYEISCTLPPLK